MLWFFFSLIAAFFDATYFMLIKKYLKTIDFYLLAAGVSLFSFIFSIGISFIKGLPIIGPDFYLYFILSSLMEIIAVYLYFRALEDHDLSLTMPMLSFTPAFLIVTSFLILGEVPTTLGAIGILLVVGGSYLLNIEKDNGDILHPFKAIINNRGTVQMLIVSLIWGVETNFIKVVVLNSDPYFTAASFSFALGAAFIGISLIKNEPIKKGFMDNYRSFIFGGAVISVSAIFINIAFTQQIVPYVISIKRLSIIFSVIYGAILFNEKNIQKRLSGSFIMVLGSVIILLF